MDLLHESFLVALEEGLFIEGLFHLDPGFLDGVQGGLERIDLPLEPVIVGLQLTLPGVLGEPFIPGCLELPLELGDFPDVVLLFGVEPGEFAVGLHQIPFERRDLVRKLVLFFAAIGCEGQPVGRNPAPGELSLELVQHLVGVRGVFALVGRRNPIQLKSPFRSVVF